MPRSRASRPRTALLLSGGGARGAYQVGVLRGLVEHGFLPRGQSGLDVLVGSSAGAINATVLAAAADAFATGLARLERVWSDIRPEQVFRTDLGSLGRIGVRWAWDISFGGMTRRVQPKSLLDTTPLRAFLSERIPFARVRYATGNPGQPFRLVDVLWLRPSRLVRQLAAKLAHRVPRIVRYLMRGLGSDASINELTSYLLFDSEFCSRLIDLGVRDVAAERERIAQFFSRPRPARKQP